jgi:hypothetical protein
MRWGLGRLQNVTRKPRSHCKYVDEPTKHAMQIWPKHDRTMVCGGKAWQLLELGPLDSVVDLIHISGRSNALWVVRKAPAEALPQVSLQSHFPGNTRTIIRALRWPRHRHRPRTDSLRRSYGTALHLINSRKGGQRRRGHRSDTIGRRRHSIGQSELH